MIYVYILSLIISFGYYLLKSTKAIQMLQQNWYDDDSRYLKWMLKNPKKIFGNLDILFLLIVPLSLFIEPMMALILFGAFYSFCIFLFLNQRKKEQVKLKLNLTKRVKRLLITASILYLLPTFSSILLIDASLIPLYFAIFGLLIYLEYFVIMVANIFNMPVERLIFKHFYRQAKNKIKGMSNLKVIGITGSYGKTSSKNILNDILSVKYNTCPSPKNYNTTNGLMLTINNYLDKFSDVFIAEMGAFKIGEIKELCTLVQPQYGILTKIGTAHLESFGSQENIQKGKFELIESLPQNGVAVLNRDDELQVSYPLKNNCQIIWIGIDNKKADIYATNIKQTQNGMTFDCIFQKEKKTVSFETCLLGSANIYNILAAIALGHYFKLEHNLLQLGVKKVKPIEHRLELKQYGDITLIDDSYNSNPVGSKMALEVLNLMPGKKIIVTPGMIELGDVQYELNKRFGEYIAAVCDEVILVGEEQTKPIYDGLIEKKYKKEQIHIINDVKVAFTLMQKLKAKETYVLLENDLPDIFNEK